MDGESRQRFAVEAKAAAQLTHPNIVTVYQLTRPMAIPLSPWSS